MTSCFSSKPAPSGTSKKDQERTQQRPEYKAAMARAGEGYAGTATGKCVVKGVCKGPEDLGAKWCDWYKRTQGRHSDQKPRSSGTRGGLQ